MNRNPFVESLTAELRSGCRNSAPPRVGLELEQFLDTRVNLKTWVKVRSDWRNDEKAIKSVGLTYDE